MALGLLSDYIHSEYCFDFHEHFNNINLSIHEHMISLHLFVASSISLIHVLYQCEELRNNFELEVCLSGSIHSRNIYLVPTMCQAL
jgi:hypothetical protein